MYLINEINPACVRTRSTTRLRVTQPLPLEALLPALRGEDATAGRPELNRKGLIAAGALLALGLVILATTWWLLRLPERDVLRALRSREQSSHVRVVVSGLHWSISHGVRVEYQVLGDGEIGTAQWRLWPFREVVVSK